MNEESIISITRCSFEIIYLSEFVDGKVASRLDRRVGGEKVLRRGNVYRVEW